MKKEFDYYRQRQEPHPLLIENGIEAIPFLHSQLAEWRDSLHHGIQFHIPNTNIVVTGSVDDVWINTVTQELIIVDYKATSKSGEVSLDADWQIGYKRQAEVYQWLFRQNGFGVSDVAYFVYCNGRTDLHRFDKQLLFNISVIPYVGSSEWVEPSIRKAYECLCSNEIPPHADDCDFCQYTLAIGSIVSHGQIK